MPSIEGKAYNGEFDMTQEIPGAPTQEEDIVLLPFENGEWCGVATPLLALGDADGAGGALLGDFSSESPDPVPHVPGASLVVVDPAFDKPCNLVLVEKNHGAKGQQHLQLVRGGPAPRPLPRKAKARAARPKRQLSVPESLARAKARASRRRSLASGSPVLVLDSPAPAAPSASTGSPGLAPSAAAAGLALEQGSPASATQSAATRSPGLAPGAAAVPPEAAPAQDLRRRTSVSPRIAQLVLERSHAYNQGNGTQGVPPVGFYRALFEEIKADLPSTATADSLRSVMRREVGEQRALEAAERADEAALFNRGPVTYLRLSQLSECLLNGP